MPALFETKGGQARHVLLSRRPFPPPLFVISRAKQHAWLMQHAGRAAVVGAVERAEPDIVYAIAYARSAATPPNPPLPRLYPTLPYLPLPRTVPLPRLYPTLPPTLSHPSGLLRRGSGRGRRRRCGMPRWQRCSRFSQVTRWSTHPNETTPMSPLNYPSNSPFIDPFH